MAKEIIAGAGGKTEAVGGVSKALEGELRMRTGDLDGAERCLAEAVTRTDPKLRSAVRLSQAQLAMARQDWPKAKAILDEVKQDENFAYRAFANESRWLQQNGETAKAKEILDEGRRRFPNNGLLLVLHITDLTTQKKFDDAREILNAERKREPDKELPYLLLSEVFDAAKKPEQAIDVLQQAAKQFPKEASIKLRLVDKLIERNRTIEVGPIMAELEGDANVNPSAIEYLKARRAVAEGDPDRAGAIIAEALKRDKHSLLLQNLSGVMERNKGNIPGALEKFKPGYDQVRHAAGRRTNLGGSGTPSDLATARATGRRSSASTQVSAASRPARDADGT
jgi:predicted Zn-dependent protease